MIYDGRHRLEILVLLYWMKVGKEDEFERNFSQEKLSTCFLPLECEDTVDITLTPYVSDFDALIYSRGICLCFNI
jgi:hypothetical protein